MPWLASSCRRWDQAPGRHPTSGAQQQRGGQRAERGAEKNQPEAHRQVAFRILRPGRGGTGNRHGTDQHHPGENVLELRGAVPEAQTEVDRQEWRDQIDQGFILALGLHAADATCTDVWVSQWRSSWRARRGWRSNWVIR